MNNSKSVAADHDFADIDIGDVFVLERVFSAEDVDGFSHLSGDFSPLHADPEYAKSTEFGGRVVHGMLVASLLSNLVGMQVPGKKALYLAQELSFRRPVFIGDRLTASAKVTSKNEGTSTLSLAMEIRNQESKVVVSGAGKVKIRRDAVDFVSAAVIPGNPSSQDKPVAVITGGSGGIGAATAEKLGAMGYHCIVVYRANAAEAQRVCQRILETGGTATPHKADIVVESDLDDLARTIEASFGRVSALVNAAIGDLERIPALDLGWNDFERYFNTQIKGVLGLSQRLFPLMKANQGASIVNVLSQVVHNSPPPEMAHYVTAKYALMGLSRALASEWAREGIRINTVSPGLARTALTQHYQEKIFRMEAVKTPLGRLVELDDIAEAIAFLLGDQSSFVTGSNLFLTGGQDMN